MRSTLIAIASNLLLFLISGHSKDRCIRYFMKKIFPDTYKQIEVRSTARRTKKRARGQIYFTRLLRQILGKQLKIRVSDKVKVAASKEMPVVKVRNEEKNINVELPQELEIKTANQQVAKSLILGDI